METIVVVLTVVYVILSVLFFSAALKAVYILVRALVKGKKVSVEPWYYRW